MIGYCEHKGLKRRTRVSCCDQLLAYFLTLVGSSQTKNTTIDYIYTNRSFIESAEDRMNVAIGIVGSAFNINVNISSYLEFDFSDGSTMRFELTLVKLDSVYQLELSLDSGIDAQGNYMVVSKSAAEGAGESTFSGSSSKDFDNYVAAINRMGIPTISAGRYSGSGTMGCITMSGGMTCYLRN